METNHVFRTIVQEGNDVDVGIITHTNLTFAKEPFVGSKDVVMVRKVEHAGVQKKSIRAKSAASCGRHHVRAAHNHRQ
jgi:hypothetical protein